jgi:hypothetical protein
MPSSYIDAVCFDAVHSPPSLPLPPHLVPSMVMFVYMSIFWICHMREKTCNLCLLNLACFAYHDDLPANNVISFLFMAEQYSILSTMCIYTTFS